MLVSELAGKASLAAKAKSLGIDLSGDARTLQAILDDVKTREAHGYSYEVAVRVARGADQAAPRPI